ncbi:MAG: DinB family protein [Chloroflexi bacterium]|nr:DinB family protein [Chloroflexota bacterium]
MEKSKLIGLLFGAWNDLDRVLDGLDPAEAVKQSDGGSSYAWTVAHLANQVDSWANVRIGRKSPHDYMSQERFRFGGTGAADDWQTIRKAALEVRETARGYLETMEDAHLDTVVPYEGSIARLRETGINLRYALIRMCAHHYFHIGEIATKRDLRGQRVGDYPGLLEECL